MQSELLTLKSSTEENRLKSLLNRWVQTEMTLKTKKWFIQDYTAEIIGKSALIWLGLSNTQVYL